MVTAFSGQPQQPEALLGAIEGWTDRRLATLAPGGLSLALWTFARLGASPSRKLLHLAADSVMRQLPAYTPLQLSRVRVQVYKT